MSTLRISKVGMAVLTACLIAASSHTLRGQDSSAQSPPEVATEATSPQLKQQCAAIAAAIHDQGFDTLAYTAPDSLKLLGQCDASAGAILPAIWQTVAADSTTLTALMWVSASVRDKRIARAIEHVLTDSSKPVLVRQAALHTLVSYGGIKRLGGIRTIVKDTTDTTYKSDTTSEHRWTVGGRFKTRDQEALYDAIKYGIQCYTDTSNL